MAAPAPAIPHASTTNNTTPARTFTVLAHENQAEFDRLLAAFQFEHRPRLQHEHFLVRQLAVSKWLLERARRFEAKAFDHLAGAELDPADPEARIVARMYETNPKALDAIQRYAAQAEKSYYRAWRQIIECKIDILEAVDRNPVVRAADRIIKNNERRQNEPKAAPLTKTKPNETKPSLRSQYPENLALCL